MKKSGILSPMRFIDENDYQRIHEASLKILAETGIVFQNDDAVELFRKNGAKVDGQRVYMTKKMVDEAVNDLQRTYPFYSRNPQRTVVIGEDLAIFPNGGAVYIQDSENGRRLATIEDYGNMMRLAQASDIINLVGAHPLNPVDVPDQYKHLYMAYEVLKNSDKPMVGWTMSGKNAKEYLDMIQISLGQVPGEIPDKRYSAFNPNPLSPLSWANETCEAIFEYCRRGQAVYILPCIMAGLTGPIRPLGMMVLQNTEILSGIVFCHLINPQTPLVYASSSSSGYMKKASYITGTPDMALINYSVLQMAHEFYHMPTRNMCGMTDAKVPDMQAGLETMQNVMMGIYAGADIINECLGILDAIMTVSYEKHIIDEEIVKRCIHLKQGIDRSDDALSLDVIQEVGPGGNYLVHQDTFTHFREPFSNTISDCEGYLDWKDKGSLDIVQRANKRYKEILEAAPETMLDATTEKDLKDYMNKIIGQ